MRLFEIPAHLPFLDALAAGVLADVGDAPEALSRVTILLPTRRSARALRGAFLRMAEGRALLLPRMRALAGLSTEDADELALPELLDLPPAVDALTRQAVLAAMAARLHPRHGGAGAPAQAWALGGELALLFDEIALEEVEPRLLAGPPEAFAVAWLARLDGLATERLATHWQITTTFLGGVAQAWNGWLADAGLLDIGVRRVRALLAQAELWRRAPPAAPVIAAGIGAGGTIPAAADLLRVVAGLPRGAVVLHALPGADRPGLWEAVREAPTHPFCGIARLLHRMGAGAGDVRPWHGDAPARTSTARAELLAQALLPARHIGAWTERSPARWRDGLRGLSRLAAPEPQAEAEAIALLLRGAVETPGAEAALVTPDRDLARRVSAALARHGVVADDSAGEPLAGTPTAAFLRLLAAAVHDRLAPVPLLAVLKHPLCAGGLDRADWLATARRFELEVLRGARPGPGLDGLRDAVIGATPRDAAGGTTPRDAAGGTTPRGAAVAAARAGLAPLLDALDHAIRPLEALAAGPPRPPANLLAALLTAAEALATTAAQPGGLRLYAGEEGEPLARHLAGLADAFALLPPVAPAEWPALLDAALAGPTAPSLRAVRTGGAAPHPRVAILGLLEARLLSFDLVVLGALEEGIWPQATPAGPWMGRPMRRDFGLPEPEARIGRVAADLLLAAAGAGEAVLSAAARRGGAPAVPARWLIRLETFLSGQGGGQGGGQGMALPRNPAAGWAAALDRPDRVRPWDRPSPAPPAALRPRRISVSEVGLLIADPYAFHARRVLRLRALPELDAEVGALEYGTLVHDAMARFLRALEADRPGGWPGPAAALTAWTRASGAALAAAAARPAVVAFWAPRLANLGEWVLEQEAAAREANALRECRAECEGRLTLPHPDGAVELVARADRLDLFSAGGWRVLDHKTGGVPTDEKLRDGSAPQLPLEAWMLEAGAFPGIPAGGRAVQATYWKLTGGDQPGEVHDRTLRGEDGIDLVDRARDKVLELVERYLLRPTPFTARPHPNREVPGHDYDHLARIAEWSDAAGEMAE